MIEHSRIGIDIGRVILSAADPDGRSDSSFLGSRDQEALETPPTEGAFDTIARIVARSGGNVWLVSKAGPRVQALTLRWLEHWRFYDVTGLHRRHVRFCRERSEKRDHAEDLGLTHFVDDRVDVHQHLRGVVRRLYLFGYQRRGTAPPPWLKATPTWADVACELSV